MRFCLRLLCIFFVVGAVIVGARSEERGPISIVSGSGANPAAIQAVVDQFRLDLGDPNNGNTSGSQDAGRREVNWDGGGAAACDRIPDPHEQLQCRSHDSRIASTTPAPVWNRAGCHHPSSARSTRRIRIFFSRQRTATLRGDRKQHRRCELFVPVQATQPSCQASAPCLRTWISRIRPA